MSDLNYGKIKPTERTMIPESVTHNGKTYRVLSIAGSMYRLDNHATVPISECTSPKLGPKAELGEFKRQDSTVIAAIVEQTDSRTAQAALDALPTATKPKAKAKK